MSDEQWRTDLAKTFAKFDADGSGKIDRKEFESLLDALGSKMSQDDRDTGFKILDADSDGQVTLDELAAWWDVVREEGQDDG